MFTRFHSHKFLMGVLLSLIFILAACAPTVPVPQTGAEPTQPAAAPTPAPTAAPTFVISGLDAEDILIQLTYEPGFVLPEYRYPFGRTPYFTLLADGRAIYVDENQDAKVMQAQFTQAEAAALLQKIRDMGFERLESHTDMCGMMADGTQSCIADASTSVMRVRLENGSLREIRNYANFSNGPATYEAIYNLLNQYTHPQAAIYVPHAATLFVRIVPPPENSSPADWPLDANYVKRAQAASDQFAAIVLNTEEAAVWQKNVGIDNSPITFQLNGQPVSGFFVPWLPGDDFTKDIAEAFPAQ
jgi:hypothetical protein